ncbi:MAG: ABC transporter permease [Anaerolineae bacterium]|nr:ABC transporter permease [Anaerolineae bacterium]
MDAIWQKIKADISSRALISTLIVITVAAASLLLTLALATLMNIGAPYDRAFDELNAAHLWLYFDRDKVRARDIERIEELPGVVGSTGVQYSVTSRVQIGDTRVWTSLRLTPPEPPAVNRLLVQEGRDWRPDDLEVLAAKDLKDLYGLQVSQVITLTQWDGKKIGLPVIGLAYNPMWDTYRSSQPPYLYISEQTLRKLYPDESAWDWSLGLRIADPETVDEIVAQVKDLLRNDVLVAHTNWRDVRESAIFGAQINFVFLGSFGLFAVVATVLVIASSVSSSVLSQFRQIGLLKALGFTQGQILLLYTGQYLILGIVGCPLGLILGLVLSPLPLKSVAASLSTTFRPSLDPVLIVVVWGVVLGSILLATWGSAYRGARANTVKAISVGAEAPRRRSFWITALAARLGASVVMVLGLNDIFAKPFRSVMTGLNLTLGVIGVVFGLTLNETLENYRQNPALLGIVYDAVVTRQEMSDSRAQGLLRRSTDVIAYYGELLIEAETSSGQAFQVRAVDGDLGAFPFQITGGRLLQPNTAEAIAGQGLLDWLGLQVGDELTLILDKNEKRPLTWQIVGKYPEPVNAGQMMIVNLASVTRAVKSAEPSRYYVKLAPNANVARLGTFLSPHPDSDLNLTLVEQAIPSVVIYLQLAILALAVVLIGIALVNVFNTSLLAMQEKVRIIGVLKTVGMTPAQVMSMSNTTTAVLALIATLTGIPFGWLFTKGMLEVLSQVYGFGRVSVRLNPLYALLLVPVLVMVSLVGSLFPARRAARLSIVEVLRHE